MAESLSFHLRRIINASEGRRSSRVYRNSHSSRDTARDDPGGARVRSGETGAWVRGASEPFPGESNVCEREGGRGASLSAVRARDKIRGEKNRIISRRVYELLGKYADRAAATKTARAIR